MLAAPVEGSLCAPVLPQRLQASYAANLERLVISQLVLGVRAGAVPAD